MSKRRIVPPREPATTVTTSDDGPALTAEFGPTPLSEVTAPKLVTARLLGYEVTAPGDIPPHVISSFLRDLKIAHERHRGIGDVTVTFPSWTPALLRDR